MAPDVRLPLEVEAPFGALRASRRDPIVLSLPSGRAILLSTSGEQ